MALRSAPHPLYMLDRGCRHKSRQVPLFPRVPLCPLWFKLPDFGRNRTESRHKHDTRCATSCL